MSKTSAEYHAFAQGISDIYWQELLRAPDEGGWIEWFWHWRENGREWDWIREQIKASPEYAWVHRPRPKLPRLVTAGSVFRKENGERFTAIECSDFNLFGRYLTEGADAIRPVLQERADLGFNMLRVWSEYQGGPDFARDIGRLVPAEHDFYYDQLLDFLSLCGEYGLYVELTAFAGVDIPGHWQKLAEVLPQATNVIVELANEVGAHPSTSINPANYQKIPGVLCSHGSNGSQALPVRPWWDYETFHTNDAPEWWRKGSHNGMELTAGDPEGNIRPSRVPVLTNEKTRPDRDGNIQHHEDDAAGCALLIAGSCFHSQAGKKSALFGQDRPFAEAFVRGAKSVNLEYQDGRYVREDPGADLRVYSKVLGDGRRQTVRIRK